VSHRLGNRNVRAVWTGPQSPLGHVCQTTVVVLSLLILAFAPLAFGAVRLWALGPVFIAIEVAGVLWIIRILNAREIPVVLSTVGPPVVALAAYGVIRYGLSEIEPIASAPMMQWLAAALFFFLVLNNVRHRWHVTVVVWVLVGMGTVVALCALWQVMAGSSSVWEFPQYDRYLGSPSGTFIRPSHGAAYLQIVFPIAAATFLFSRRRFEEKVAMAIACFLMAAALLLIAAPNGWLGWLASMIVLLVYIIKRGSKKSRWLMVGVGLLGLVLVAALIGLLASGASERGSPTTEQQYPGALWRAAWQMARGNLLLGAGPGMFRWLYPSYRTVQGVMDTPDNEYWTVFSECGVIGCVLVVWVFVTFVIAAMQILSVRASRYSASTPSNRYAFAVGGLAAVIAVAIGVIFDSSLHAPANLFALVAIMGTTLTCGVHPSGKIEEDEELPGRYAPLAVKGVNKVALAASLAIVVLLFASRLRKSYPSDFCLRLARQAGDSLDWGTARERYLQAWGFDRRNFEVTTAMGDFLSARATWDIAQREKLLDEALIWYERAFTANPYAMDIQVKIGRVYDALGERDLAEERYRRAIQADPENESYRAQLGLHGLRWGDTEEAVTSFARAYELGGDDPLPEVELRRLGKLGP
jgi:O-antigen ligase/polysaccharide polymerase Wzy-like membrane protein/tetratricopeptide repeat protein